MAAARPSVESISQAWRDLSVLEEPHRRISVGQCRGRGLVMLSRSRERFVEIVGHGLIDDEELAQVL